VLIAGVIVIILSRWAEWDWCWGWCCYSRGLVEHWNAFANDAEACEWNLL